MTVKSQKSDTSELVIFTLCLTAGFLEMLQKFPLKKIKIKIKRSAQSRFWIKISSWGRLCDIACHLVMSAVKYKGIHNPAYTPIKVTKIKLRHTNVGTSPPLPHTNISANATNWRWANTTSNGTNSFKCQSPPMLCWLCMLAPPTNRGNTRQLVITSTV